MPQRKWSLLALVVALGACVYVMADNPAPPAASAASGVVVDKDKRTVTVDAKIAPRKIDDPRYDKIYPLEVVACWAFPKGQKAHETVVTIDCLPSEVHKAVESLGLKPGKPENGGAKEPQGPEVNIYLELPTEAGETKRVPIEKVMIDGKTGKPLGKRKWRFTGSTMVQTDPTKDEKSYGADGTGTLICVFPVTDLTVFQANLKFDDQRYVDLETDKKLLPKEGAPVKLVIEVPEQK